MFVCGPLPLCDGTVRCDHGLLPAPAPAVLDLLQGVPVRGIQSEGETVTPTAIALLKGLGAQFGAWPEMTIARTALVYGGRVLPGVPNGALFATGTLIGGEASTSSVV
jgi:pyridinium-3,5-bisthiocarboxylic acid mononucleotide nickel chelatase